MKKLLATCLCLGMTLSLSGCSFGQFTEKVVNLVHPQPEVVTESKPRVYMDEMKGTLVDFSGNMLTLNYNDQDYTFDVSQATLECTDGMLIGEEISIIYEGQIADQTTDTSSLHTLKVVDDYHNKPALTEHILTGKLVDLTENTLSVACSDGITTRFPITGREMYFTKGISKDIPVYIHYYGELAPAASEESHLLTGSNLKVVSVSDVDPFSAPKAVPIPKGKKADKVHAIIQDVDFNHLTVVVDGSSAVIDLDMSSIPCYFPGGVVPGAYLHFIYSGTFDGSSLNGIEVLCILGDQPSQMKTKDILFRVSGTIFAKTANTITIRTSDEAVLTFNIATAVNQTGGGLEIGDGIRITFNPLESQNTNLYAATLIEDAY